MSKQTILVSKDGVKTAGGSIILPVVGKVTFDDNGHIAVDSDKVEELIQSTKDSIQLAVVGSIEDTRNQAMSELEIALKDAPLKELLELVREADLGIEPMKLAAMSKEKLIQLLVQQERKMVEPKEDQLPVDDSTQDQSVDDNNDQDQQKTQDPVKPVGKPNWKPK